MAKFIVEYGVIRGKAYAIECKTVKQAQQTLAEACAKMLKNPHHPTAYPNYWADIQGKSNNAVSWGDAKHFGGIRKDTGVIDWSGRGTLAEQYKRKARAK